MAQLPANRRFNVYEYHQMAAGGILTEDDPVELIDGEIVEMPPTGSIEAACVSRLSHLFGRVAGDDVTVRTRLPIRLDEHSEPEPDVALVRPRPDFYAAAHPRPGDVLLAIEVADTTLRFDRLVKAPLYARAEIPEYWLVDLIGERVEVYRGPAADRYQTVRAFRRGERLSCEALTAVDIAVDDILG